MWNTHLCREYSINVHSTIPDITLNTVGKTGDVSETKRTFITLLLKNVNFAPAKKA